MSREKHKKWTWLVSTFMPAWSLNFSKEQVKSSWAKSCIQGAGQQLWVDRVSMNLSVLFLNPFWGRIHAAKPISNEYAFWCRPPGNVNHHNFTQLSTVLQSLTSQAPNFFFFFSHSRQLWGRRCRWGVPALSVTILCQEYLWQLPHLWWHKPTGFGKKR